MSIKILFKQCMRGESLLRTFQNLDVAKFVKITGKTLDLGANKGTASYYSYLKKEQDSEFTFVDYYSNSKNILKFDLNKPFPIDTLSYNNILLFNVMDIIFNTKNLLSETYRILSKDGILYGSVPFLHKYYKDPVNYWRFTHEAIEILLNEAGFTKATIKTHGIGCFTAAIHQFSYLFSKIFILRPLLFILWIGAIGLDKILSKYWKTNKQYYLGIFFVAKK